MKRVQRAQALQDIADLGDRVLFLRCLLETQSYDHPSCSAIISDEANFICSFADDEWDEEWLGRVRLLSRLLRDARLNEEAGLSGKYLSAEEFYNRLVDGKHSRLLRLFSRYASHDAAAALRLADHLGVDLVRDFPRLIVENCDNPAFLAMALDRANAPDANVSDWSTTLAEAGLRYQVVAKTLHEIQRSGAITAAANEAGRRYSWFIHKDPFKRLRSLYTDCITVACRPKHNSDPLTVRRPVEVSPVEELPFVSRLRQIRPPGKLLHPAVFYVPTMIPVVAFLGLFIWAFIFIITHPNYQSPSTGSSTQSDRSWIGFVMGSHSICGFRVSLYVSCNVSQLSWRRLPAAHKSI